MSDETGSIVYAFILSLLVTFLAVRGGYFKTQNEKPYPIPLHYLFGALATYLGTSLILLPLFYLFLIKTLFRDKGFSFLHFQAFLTKEQMGWLQVASFCLLFIAIMIYLFCLKKNVLKAIFFGNKKGEIWKNIGFGLLTLVVAYPVVLFVNLITRVLLKELFGEFVVDQVAVNELKAVSGYPLLFFLFGLLVMTFIPFVEEVLFRGFLQTTLRRYLGKGWTIFLTSLLFSLAHFSKSQEIGNIELLISLFALSCYISFIYERQRNLFAPMAVHAAFNAVTILGIFSGYGK